jgi:hypothetical protein
MRSKFLHSETRLRAFSVARSARHYILRFDPVLFS